MKIKCQRQPVTCVCLCVVGGVFLSAWLANVHVSCDVFLSPVLSDYVLFFLFFSNLCGRQEECYIFIQITCAARIGTK